MPNFSPYTSHTLDEVARTGVYAIVNKVNGKWYVGSATVIASKPSESGFYSRWDDHIRRLEENRHYCRHLQKAWNKYKPDSFEFKILDYIDDEEQKILDKEQEYLDAYWDKRHSILYNSSRHARSGMKGRKHNKSFYEKIKNYKHSDETRKKMSEAHKNLPHSEETRKKIGLAHKGKKLSQEQIEFLRKLNTGREGNGKHYVLFSPDGVRTEIYNMSRFCKENNLSVSSMVQVANGKINQYKGWTLDGKYKPVKYLYRVLSPDGIVYETDNMKKFCREHDLHSAAMFRVLKGTALQHKGWTGAA